jgi:hypothetical protein
MGLHIFLRGIDIGTFLYVDDVRTSQETHAFTACYREIFTLFIGRLCLYLTRNTRLHGLLQRNLYSLICRLCSYLTGNTRLQGLLQRNLYSFYMYMMFVPHRKHTPSRPVTEKSLPFLYVDDFRTSQETHLWVFTASYGNSFSYFLWMLDK